MQDFTQELIQDDQTTKFILAGKATFTVRNEQTGNRFTFKIKQATKNTKLFWVSVLTQSDNESEDSYVYLGTFSKDQGYMHSPKSRIAPSATSSKVAVWYLKHLFNNTLPDYIKTYHEGMCGRCGRKLTVPESIIDGFGSECMQIMNKQNINIAYQKSEAN